MASTSKEISSPLTLPLLIVLSPRGDTTVPVNFSPSTLNVYTSFISSPSGRVIFASQRPLKSGAFFSLFVSLLCDSAFGLSAAGVCCSSAANDQEQARKQNIMAISPVTLMAFPFVYKRLVGILRILLSGASHIVKFIYPLLTMISRGR